MRMLAATWKEASKFIGEAWKVMEKNGCGEDGIEWCIRQIEDDPEEHSVGYGGSLTREGRAELDAAFMEGEQRRMGAVIGLVGYRHPIHVARLVMEQCPHNMLVGEGAAQFAQRMGCEKREMISPEAAEEYAEFCRETRKMGGHDTVGIISLCDGHFACGLSTSGLKFRMPGRAADSGIPGCGYFCDDSVGAAVCTGVGEDIMRGALAAKAFFYMEQGDSAMQAAERAVADVHRRVRNIGRVAAVTVDREGNVGAAANHNEFFRTLADETGRVSVVHIDNVNGDVPNPVGEPYDILGEMRR